MAGIAPAFNVYLQSIHDTGVNGEVLIDIKNEAEFKEVVLDTLGIQNKLHRRLLSTA